MEPITTATIVISLLTGVAMGFATIATGNFGIKAAADAIGAIGLIGFLYLIMPTITWGTPTLEGAESVANFTVSAVLALVCYAVGDAFGSFGYVAVTGSQG